MPVQPCFVLRESSGAVESVEFHPNEPALLSGSTKGCVKVWDTQSRRAKTGCAPLSTSGPVVKVAWIGAAPHHATLVQVKEGRFSVWNVQRLGEDPLFESYEEQCGFCQAAVISDYSLAIPGTVAKVIRIWDVQSGSQISSLKSEEDLGAPTSITRCGIEQQALLGGYESGDVALWDLRTPERPLVKEKAATSPVTCLAVDSKGKGALLGSPESEFVALKLSHETGCSKRSVPLPEKGLSSIAIRQDRRIFATGGWDSKLRIWNYRNLKQLGEIGHHSQEITSLDFHAGGQLACASRDGGISIWNLYSTAN